MKGLILSGGSGSRMRPFTHSIAKQLLPVANKPVLYYCMDLLVTAGIKEIAVIVGDTFNQIKSSLLDGSRWGVKITYIYQERPQGLAHAVSLAEQFMDDSPFVMLLGDNLIEDDLTQFIRRFDPAIHSAAVVLKAVTNPQQFGVAKIHDNKIVFLVEKPQDPPSNLAIMGIYLFTPQIFTAIKCIKPSARGELEITDAIQYLIKTGKAVLPLTSTAPWHDVGCADDLLKANVRVLEKNYQSKQVSTPHSTTVINSIIEGPAVIGENCKIINSYIGPYTSVGDDTYIDNCSIKNSIIFGRCALKKLPYLIDSSVIADNFLLEGPLSNRLSIIAGSNCKFKFS